MNVLVESMRPDSSTNWVVQSSISSQDRFEGNLHGKCLKVHHGSVIRGQFQPAF